MLCHCSFYFILTTNVVWVDYERIKLWEMMGKSDQGVLVHKLKCFSSSYLFIYLVIFGFGALTLIEVIGNLLSLCRASAPWRLEQRADMSLLSEMTSCVCSHPELTMSSRSRVEVRWVSCLLAACCVETCRAVSCASSVDHAEPKSFTHKQAPFAQCFIL